MNRICKIFLLLLFLFFFEYSINGQNDSCVQKGKFEIGITGGINFFNLRGNDIAVKNFTKGKIGDGGGLTVQRNLNNIFAIQTGLLFEEKNCVAEIPTGTSNLTYPGEVRRETKMAYYQIPLMLKISFGRKKNIFITSGGYVGFISKDRIKHIFPNYSFTHNVASNDTRKEYGLTVGAGVNFLLLKKLEMSIEARNNIGLTNVRNNVSSEILKTNTFNIMLGLKIQFATKKKNDSTHTKEKKVFVKLFYSPHCSYRLKNEQEIQFGKYSQYDLGGGFGSTYFIYNSSIEIPKITSELGILMEFAISKHFNLNLGNTYNHEGYTTKKRDFEIISAGQTSSGSVIFRDTTILQNQSIDFDYYFLSAPIILNYQYKINNNLYYIGIGILPQILTKHNFQFSNAPKYDYLLNNYDSSEENKFKYMEAILLFYSVDMGIEFSLGDKRVLFLEPDCKIGIGTLSRKTGLWSAGFKIGVKFL